MAGDMSVKIDLKKHGLKKIRFTKLHDGDEFNIASDFHPMMSFPYTFYCRKLVGDIIEFADGQPMGKLRTATDFAKDNKIVFVKA